MDSPFILSGLLVTAASATDSCDIKVLSNSIVPNLCPEILITSSDRPKSQK